MKQKTEILYETMVNGKCYSLYAMSDNRNTTVADIS